MISMRLEHNVGVLLGLVCCSVANAGPFTEPGQPASVMVAWATAVDSFTPGLIDPKDPGQGTVSTVVLDTPLGPANTTGVKPIGNEGEIVLEFYDFMHNGIGDDFSVFENGFFAPGGCLCELAFLEVSSDGVNFLGFEVEAL